MGVSPILVSFHLRGHFPLSHDYGRRGKLFTLDTQFTQTKLTSLELSFLFECFHDYGRIGYLNQVFQRRFFRFSRRNGSKMVPGFTSSCRAVGMGASMGSMALADLGDFFALGIRLGIRWKE